MNRDSHTIPPSTEQPSSVVQHKDEAPCCEPTKKASCCEPAAKGACCGPTGNGKKGCC